MKKRLISLFLIGIITISSVFAAMNLNVPLEASHGENQVIGSLFYLGSIGSDFKASSIGVAAFYQNKMSDNIGIYANGGVGKPLSLEIDNVSDFSSTTAVCIQSGPYYIIPIQENMLVKVGVALDLSALAGKETVSGDEDIVLSIGVGAFGAFEYILMDKINLVGSLTLGFDPVVWMTNTTTNELEKLSGGWLVNIMPSVGVSYHF
ncbi:MAG: hypothetical protein ACPKM0_05855 [Pleomorphochaeta sp.]